MKTKQEQIDYLYKHYGYKFPMKAKYIRSSDRIYFSNDFQDREEIEFEWYCEKPSGNADGYAYYIGKNEFAKLVHISELEAI